MIRWRVTAFVVLLGGIPCISAADTPQQPAIHAAPAAVEASRFDPARHMRVSEVKPGMRGYGLSVFQGSKIERFEVEVLSILKNFNPKYDVVLIRCHGDYLEHTGSIAGMSGSPIFLKDAAGAERMIGAFAYGWPLTKDPVAGVQPIEYMLGLQTTPHEPRLDGSTATSQPTTAPVGASVDHEQHPVVPPARGRLSWSLADAGLLPRPVRSPRENVPLVSQEGPAETFTGNADAMPRLQALATPLMTSGLSPSVLRDIAPLFKRCGLTPLQSGIGGSGVNADPPPKLEPGSTLAVPLMTGDVELTAIGTCTEVLGDRVYGFGHPFNNEGSVSLPMGTGTINGVIANLQTSFKLGSLTANRGTLTVDAAVGVAGVSGPVAPMIPIDFTVDRGDGEPPRSYQFRAVLHPKLTPMVIGAAFAAAVTGSSELPQYNTLDYDLQLEFNSGETLRIANRAVNTSPGELFGELGIPMQAASDNPFRRVLVRKVSGKIRVSPVARQAQLMNVTVPRAKYHPGELVKAYATVKPFRAEEQTIPLELELPHDLPQGTYQLVISDAERFFQDQQQATPFRFTAEKVEDVFAILKDVTAIRENALYIRLLRQPDGVAIGRAALQRLPSSRRQVLLGAGRSSTTVFVSSTVKVVPTDLVMSGSAEFTLNIDASSKVTVGGVKKPEAPAAPPKAEEPKGAKSPAGVDVPAPKEPPKEPPLKNPPAP